MNFTTWTDSLIRFRSRNISIAGMSVAIFRCACVRVAFLCLLPASAQHARQWQPLFDGKSLDGWRDAPFKGRGAVRVENETVVLEPGSPLTGVNWTKEFPKSNYEVR